MEVLARKVQDVLADLRPGVAQGLVEELICEFSDAYARLVRPTFELTALDEYPALVFAAPPADFEP